MTKVAQHSAGRKALLEAAKVYGLELTENDIKNVLRDLKEKGFITQSRGRKGATITAKGLMWLNEQKG